MKTALGISIQTKGSRHAIHTPSLAMVKLTAQLQKDALATETAPLG